MILWRVRDNLGQPRESGRENPSKMFKRENDTLAGGGGGVEGGGGGGGCQLMLFQNIDSKSDRK